MSDEIVNVKVYVNDDGIKMVTLKDLELVLEKCHKNNEILRSIIKEVREYMKTLSDEYASDDYDIKCDVFCKIFYEILDKEGSSNEM